MTNKNILMYGPLCPPIHGQSLSFTLITQNFLCGKKYIVNTNYTNAGVFGKAYITLRAVVQSLYYLSTKKIDLVFFSSSRSVSGAVKDLCLINIAAFFKVKMVNHVQGADFDNLLTNKPRWFTKWVENSYNKVQTTIVLMEGMKKPFMRFKSMQLRVLPNVYDPALDQFDDSGKVKNDEYFELLYLSNLMRTKGIIEVVDAFRLWSQKQKNVRLNIAGTFVNDAECSAQEIKDIFDERVKGADNIVYHGVVKGENKSKLLYASDVFVLPSYYAAEAFPLSIVEAMRAGCAIITTRFNYLEEVVTPKNGVLVNIRDVNALVDAFDYLIKNPKTLQEIKDNNVAEAKEKYSLATSLESLARIINEQ